MWGGNRLLARVKLCSVVNPKSAFHCSSAENRITKRGFSAANGDSVTHMRQGLPLQRLFAAPLRSSSPSRTYRLVTGSFEVRQFQPDLVGFGSVVFYMEIVSGHDGCSHFWREHSSLSGTNARAITGVDDNSAGNLIVPAYDWINRAIKRSVCQHFRRHRPRSNGSLSSGTEK